ncbi:right-handed parallel beta-helix repeat-containing protein [Vibrio parahaemolyticus]|uniref:right-handed parallel beta-helix repeat-containing protein n=1 Tax=Vibrio mediterranei TaxID=689 RepID=UPI00406770BA
MKKHTLAACLSLALSPAVLAVELDPNDLTWKAITFGQSTDANFGSTILPEKVGTNEVLVNGQPAESGPIARQFTIESRGGKLANSHEGLTFYYTELPTSNNFVLSASVTLEQLGPETGATPNRQEGAGIMVRDILGAERLLPQPEGHEEFPSASNMVMNLLRSHTRSNDGMTNINASFREGVYQPWGTPGNRLSRVDYVEGVPYGSQTQFQMTLERTNEGFIVTYSDGKNTTSEVVKGAHADIVEMQDPASQYLGFFASRNAKISVSDVSLTLSEANTKEAPAFKAPMGDLVFELASGTISATDQYPVQARANYSGVYEAVHNGQVLAKEQVTAGEMFHKLAALSAQSNEFEIRFTPIEGPTKETQIERFSVTKKAVVNPERIIVSPSGTGLGDGSEQTPLDLASAITLLAPGGTIVLKDGDYEGLTVPLTVSGTPGQPKHLIAEGDSVRFISQLEHDANYWHYEGIVVAGARFIVQGSHNRFEKMVTHSAPDTGFQITSPEGVGRALWASYNTVVDSESYNNMDPSQINADGFAAKMRVGDGNTFIRCVSHHNIDDGWDLFNKVEDGPNGAVTILDSISFNNGRTLDVENKGGTIGNGFKLGGEGLPVPHVIKNSLSFNNHMDGFTDNFNPGSVTVKNNVALNNQRFNYLFRQSPYSGEVEQGTFIDNRSYRIDMDSRYDDVVHSSYAKDNVFIQDGVSRDDEGNQVDPALLTTIKQALVAYDEEKATTERLFKLKTLTN